MWTPEKKTFALESVQRLAQYIQMDRPDRMLPLAWALLGMSLDEMAEQGVDIARQQGMHDAPSHLTTQWALLARGLKDDLTARMEQFRVETNATAPGMIDEVKGLDDTAGAPPEGDEE